MNACVRRCSEANNEPWPYGSHYRHSRKNVVSALRLQTIVFSFYCLFFVLVFFVTYFLASPPILVFSIVYYMWLLRLWFVRADKLYPFFCMLVVVVYSISSLFQDFGRHIFFIFLNLLPFWISPFVRLHIVVSRWSCHHFKFNFISWHPLLFTFHLTERSAIFYFVDSWWTPWTVVELQVRISMNFLWNCLKRH